MKRITMVIAGLGGRGHDIYGNYAMEHPDEVEIAAVADPRPERLELAQREWNIPAERCFATAEELFAQPQLADAAVIATQDRQHVVHAEAALKGGYHLLLEKPVAVDIEGCLEVLRLARRYQRHVVVCHVLRYTPFYNAIKRIIEDGRIGEVVTIQAMEQVGYWHQAHSYVRGNWRRADESSPMILAKCCHDMDILIWLTGKRARYVSSYGNNYLFRAEKAPAGAAQRCMDCAVRAGCPYDAVRYYLESGRTSVRAGRVHWPINVLDPHPTPENIEQALRTGPYGRCVYHCDNDVVDHQVVNIELDGGTTINFTMSAFTERCYRTIKVMGTTAVWRENMDLSRCGTTLRPQRRNGPECNGRFHGRAWRRRRRYGETVCRTAGQRAGRRDALFCGTLHRKSSGGASGRALPHGTWPQPARGAVSIVRICLFVKEIVF